MFGRNRVTVPDDHVVVPRVDYLDLCDRASSATAARVLGTTPAPSTPQRAAQGQRDWSEDDIERLLNEHYRQVLASKEGRRMWRKLLADAAAAERVDKIKNGS